MGEHLIDGKFQSDKYPTTPRGCVPLKCTDPMAQPYLYAYAQDRRHVDPVFSDDLEAALSNAGYAPDADSIKMVIDIDSELLDKIAHMSGDEVFWNDEAHQKMVISTLLHIGYEEKKAELDAMRNQMGMF